MRNRFTISIFALVSIHALSAFAEEQTAQLPNDGWWIRYSTTTTLETDGQVSASIIKCRLTYSLVGTTIEDGEKCRWVELEDFCPLPDEEDKKGRKSVVLSKFLVPEKDLLESEQPLKRVKRAWKKVNRRDARLVHAQHATISENPNLMIFPGQWQKTATVNKERIVDYQQGKLTLTHAQVREDSIPAIINRPRVGYFGTNVLGFGGIEPRMVEYTAWFDQTLSPVFAAAKVKRKFYLDNELKGFIEDDIVVENYGSDAKSQLPDNN